MTIYPDDWLCNNVGGESWTTTVRPLQPQHATATRACLHARVFIIKCPNMNDIPAETIYSTRAKTQEGWT